MDAKPGTREPTDVFSTTGDRHVIFFRNQGDLIACLKYLKAAGRRVARNRLLSDAALRTSAVMLLLLYKSNRFKALVEWVQCAIKTIAFRCAASASQRSGLQARLYSV